MFKDIVIFGTGEIAELAFYYFINDSRYNVVAFTADSKYIEDSTFNGLPLVPIELLEENFPHTKYGAHVALSYSKLNQVRKEKYHLLKKMGYELVSYVCSKSCIWPDLTVGDNCFILENQTIQPTVKIGNNVVIWSGNHLGHASVVKDHAYISSHVCISGHSIIGESCFLGVNSTIKDYVSLGDRVFVTMNASVTKDVPSDSAVVGSSSKIHVNDRVSRRLKKIYFGL